MTRILIVDDEPKIVRAVKRHLKMNGHEVAEAENGKQAFQILETFVPEVILLDLMMPEMDGNEFCKRIRKDINYRNVYIIILSAKAREEDRLFGLDIGADDYLTKPFDPKELLDRIGIYHTLKSANTDSMTGLYNKSFFNSSVRQEIARYNRKQGDFSLVLMNIDHFDRVKETYGHSAGDAVLVRLAQLLKINSRSTDICSRWDGDEFAIILTGTPKSGAGVFGEKMRRVVESAQFPDVGPITVSIGISIFQGDEKLFFETADAALIEAKSDGRNRVKIA